MANLKHRQYSFLLVGALALGLLNPPAKASDVEKNPWLYFGADLGYTSVSPSDSIRESSRDGYAGHLKVLGSKYWEKWVADLGLGYQYHMASGADRFSFLPDAKIKVRTRSGFLEFSPRYRLDPNWQLGAVLNGFFGTDVTFSEAATSNSMNFSLAGGARVDYETPGEQHRWRFGAQIMHDLTVSDRGIWWVMADIQFGFPVIFGGKAAPAVVEPAPTPTPAPTPAPKATPEPSPTPVPVAAPPARPIAPRFAEVTPEKGVKIYLGEAVLRFKTASAELRPSSKPILEKVAKYLKKSPDAWRMMRVDGHADRRGKLEYNIRLSRARAEKVKIELSKLGIPIKKLAADGYGPNRPIDPANDLEAYALNRRVELWIDGVTNPEAIVRDLNELK